MKARLRWALAACVVVSLLLLALTLGRVAERGRFARAFSSYGSGPEGVRGLYLLAAELGFPTLRWSQDLARLPAGGTLVALGSCETGMPRALSRYEREELVRWLKRGGVLLVAGVRQYLPSELGVEFAFDPSCPEAGASADRSDGVAPDEPPPQDAGQAIVVEADGGGVVPAPVQALAAQGADAGVPNPASQETTAVEGEEAIWGVPMAPVMRGMPIVPFRQPGRLKILSDASTETLLAAPELDRASSTTSLLPLAATRRIGLGRVIVLAAANMLQNDELDSSEGALLFARLLQAYAERGPVVFDEYHMGIGERRSLMQYLRQLGAMPMVFQLLLCAVVLLWRAGARFGALRSPIEARPAGTVSFVTALGGLYQAAGDASAALRLIARAGLARIAAHHGVAAVQAAALERALEARGARTARQAVQRIVAAVSSTRADALPQIVQRIDAAVASATGDAAETSRRTRVRFLGWRGRRR